MKVNLPENINDILKPLQIAAHMDTRPNNENYFYVKVLYNTFYFKLYSPFSYQSNNQLKEMDEIYKMDTTVFLHISTGIRCEYHIHEDYSGEEYKLGSIFVITIDNNVYNILDVDYTNNCVITEYGKIAFDKLKRTVDKTD